MATGIPDMIPLFEMIRKWDGTVCVQLKLHTVNFINSVLNSSVAARCFQFRTVTEAVSAGVMFKGPSSTCGSLFSSARRPLPQTFPQTHSAGWRVWEKDGPLKPEHPKC